MSLLICSLSEKNRTPITNTVVEAMEKLGHKATGNNPFLASLVCDLCHGRSKKFPYVFGLTTCEDDFEYSVEVDETGNYSISNPLIHGRNQTNDPAFDRISNFAAHPEYNSLYIINRVVERINSLVECDSQGMRTFEGHEAKCGHNNIFCTCGGRRFTR